MPPWMGLWPSAPGQGWPQRGALPPPLRPPAGPLPALPCRPSLLTGGRGGPAAALTAGLSAVLRRDPKRDGLLPRSPAGPEGLPRSGGARLVSPLRPPGRGGAGPAPLPPRGGADARAVRRGRAESGDTRRVPPHWRCSNAPRPRRPSPTMCCESSGPTRACRPSSSPRCCSGWARRRP